MVNNCDDVELRQIKGYRLFGRQIGKIAEISRIEKPVYARTIKPVFADRAYPLNVKDSNITRIEKGTITIHLAQKVIANGQAPVPAGTWGLVTTIDFPYNGDHFNDDCVAVLFENHPMAKFVSFDQLYLEEIPSTPIRASELRE